MEDTITLYELYFIGSLFLFAFFVAEIYYRYKYIPAMRRWAEDGNT